MSEIYSILVVIACFVSAGVGAMIGAGKGKIGKGALLGFFFGPVGWVLIMLDIGALGITLTLGLFGGIIVAGVRSAERDRDRMEELQKQARIGMADAEAEAATPLPTPSPSSTPDAIASSPATAASPRSIYPPGVDTPEQRRNYLQSLAEAKKGSLAPQPSTSVRVRGY